jgi:hypothetical protein
VVYEQLLREPSFFAPADGHRIVDIDHGAASRGRLNVTSVAERHLVSSLRSAPASGASPGFRLLVCSPRVLDQHIWPLPLSSGTLQDILDHFGVPSLFPRAICHHIPIGTTFECFDRDGVSGLLIRTNLSWTWQYALAIVHDSVSKSTTAILLGLRANEVDDVLESIQQCIQYMDCPAMLPCIVIDKALDALLKDAELRRKSLLEICYGTGLHGFHRASFKDQYDERDDLDLDVLMQKLTSLSDACAGISAVCKMQRGFIETVAQIKDEWALSNESVSSRYAAQRLRFFAQFLSGVESKISYTQSSAQGQVQTIYTLISQRDSRNQLMLAETTKKLALLSRKDSTDMRVIAAVTLIFLPATFTATFFSTSFLDFTPAESDHVSSWIWLYWVLTFGLTVIVMSAWWFSARQQHRKADAEFHLRPAAVQDESKVDAVEVLQSSHESRPPAARVEALRPYLSGSVSQDVFAKRSKKTLFPIQSVP